MTDLEKYNLQGNSKLVTLNFSNEEDWLEIRTKGIGGSDIGTIMGINPHSSPLKIYKQKVEGYREDLSDNIFVRKGKDLENVILTNYVQPKLSKLGYTVGKPDFMIVNTDYPYFRANVDGIAFKESTSYEDNMIVEIKFVSTFAEVNWNGPDYCGIPASYYAQVQLYMLVTGAKSALVCALFDSDWDVHYFLISRDDVFINKLIKAGGEFYNYHMLLKIPPRISFEFDKDEAIEAVKETPKNLTPDDEMNKYVEMYLANELKLKKASETQSKLKDLIFEKYTAGFCPSDPKHKVKSSVVSSHRFSSTKFKADQPELYEQYCEDSESPRFTIK